MREPSEIEFMEQPECEVFRDDCGDVVSAYIRLRPQSVRAVRTVRADGPLMVDILLAADGGPIGVVILESLGNIPREGEE